MVLLFFSILLRKLDYGSQVCVVLAVYPNLVRLLLGLFLSSLSKKLSDKGIVYQGLTVALLFLLLIIDVSILN